MHSAPQTFSLVPCVPLSVLQWLEVKIETNRDHVTVVIELFVDNVLILGLYFFHPNVPVRPVNGDVLIQKQL